MMIRHSEYRPQTIASPYQNDLNKVTLKAVNPPKITRPIAEVGLGAWGVPLLEAASDLCIQSPESSILHSQKAQNSNPKSITLSPQT